MFWNFDVKLVAEPLGFMTRTLARDFVGLPREVASPRLREVWSGAVIFDGETDIRVTHPSVANFTFKFVVDVYPDSLVSQLIAEGDGDYAEISLYANQQHVIAVGTPTSVKGLNKKAQKLLDVLKEEYNIGHIPSLSERERRAMKGDVIAAAMTASIVIALSDGELRHEEKERIVEILSGYKKGLMSAQEILAMAEAHIEGVVQIGESAWPGLMHQMTKGMSFAAKKVIMHAAGTMAITDGTFSDAEKQKIAGLAAWMELDRSQLREWMQEFDVTVKQAEIMGLID